jgi:hypothetical protein
MDLTAREWSPPTMTQATTRTTVEVVRAVMAMVVSAPSNYSLERTVIHRGPHARRSDYVPPGFGNVHRGRPFTDTLDSSQVTSRLIAAVPKLASLDIERSLTFFERLGFNRLHVSREYGVAMRDGVSIHFWLCSDARTPTETGCRISVAGIDELFSAFSKLGVVHPNGHLENKPWGMREFSILDTDGNLVTFNEAAV